MRQVGNFLCADYFDNTGGINTADSPFRVLDSQATGGQNFEYTLTGGFRKIKGATKVNSSADTALKTYRLALHTTSSGTKTVIRAAGRKIQAVNLSTPSFTALSEDTIAAGTDILQADNTTPVVSSQFNTTSVNTHWLAGGGMSLPYAVYSTTKVTKNGVQELAGSIGLTVSADAGTPNFAAAGYYRYAVALRKTSTQAIGNATLFKEVNVAVATDKVTIDLTSLTAFDTTKYDKIYIYRSAVSVTSVGNVAFTTGDLIAQATSTDTSYVDKGEYISTSQNVPQAGNTVLDNSVLPAGTYNTLAVYKRRLVTASGSTLYLSDLNKPESWPTVNTITIPSGGPITGLAVISYNTPSSSTIDELLVIFKEQETWVLTGTTADITDANAFSLKFIDTVGCAGQSLIVKANGYLAWMDYRGIYMWSGTGSPIYCSRLIGDIFKEDGVIDKSKLSLGWGDYYRNRDLIVWVVSTITEGEQMFSIKLDTRLTLPQISNNLGGRVIDAVLMQDVLTSPLYAGAAIVPSTEEMLLTGDNAGHIYKRFDSYTDSGGAIDFRYESKYFDMGSPGLAKRYHTVIAWVEDTSDEELVLDFWTRYTFGEGEQGTVSAQISSQVAEALYDLAYYDSAFYDLTNRIFKPVVFHLASSQNAHEGDCIKVRFKQGSANAPVTIAGFSILFNEIALRK